MLPRRPFATLRRLLRAGDAFGKPIQHGDVTVIPVASIIGGGGAGAGEPGTSSAPGESGGAGAAARGGAGAGLGFGLMARPVGAFEIRDGKTRWRPAVDVTRLALGAMVAGVLLARLLLRDR
jgi:uncharacterized spore protein YtfJ